MIRKKLITFGLAVFLALGTAHSSFAEISSTTMENCGAYLFEWRPVDCGDGVVVFCDLLFGTPCNCSAALLNNSQYTDKIDVITGMNLSMILEFVGSRSLGMGNESIISTGIEGIVDFKKLYQERMKQFDQ